MESQEDHLTRVSPEPETTGDRCFHGGAFFEAIGDTFDDLSRRSRVINADVLDAWFPPAPRVLETLREHLPWLLATSPPTDCGGMTRVLAETRGVPASCILPGAGSSALIFLAFTRWLNPDSRVLLLDPTYGEYEHVLKRVVQCHVDRLTQKREDDYRIDLDRLVEASQRDYDLVVLVNPNSPTGQHVPRDEMVSALRRFPNRTRTWIDEAYVDYVGATATLETFASESPAVIVCKSMSKVYALSGVRAAYLCASAEQLSTLRPFVPPWAVGLPAQVAAVEALKDPSYYAQRYRETHELRQQLATSIAEAGDIEPVRGVANFVLCHLNPRGPTADEVVGHCREHGVFVRDVTSMGTAMGRHSIRVAVKDAKANERITAALHRATCG